jgi:hypothetical protein
MSFRGPQALSDTPEGVPFLSFHTDSSGRHVCYAATRTMGGAHIAHFGRRGDYATLEDRTQGKNRPCVRHPAAWR